MWSQIVYMRVIYNCWRILYSSCVLFMFVFIFNGDCLKMDKYYFCLVRYLEKNKYKRCVFRHCSILFFIPKKKKKGGGRRKGRLWLLHWSQTGKLFVGNPSRLGKMYSMTAFGAYPLFPVRNSLIISGICEAKDVFLIKFKMHFNMCI